jgi:TPR repeat protein
LPRAAEYFAQAANAGDAEARYNYGVMRLTGQDGNPPDPAAAHGHFENAAAQEFAPALNGLGIGHMGKGNGMSTGKERDFVKAAQYFRRAARKNSADGHYNLGALYKDGQGMPKNVPAAMMHFVIAAMLGQHRAQWMLGDTLHSPTSFLSQYLTEYQYSKNKTHIELEDVASWVNNKDGYNTIANASVLGGVIVNISGTVVKLPLKMSCNDAVRYLRPLAETRSAGHNFRNGVMHYLEGNMGMAEKSFQASAWMGLKVGASNSAWLLRKKKRAAEGSEMLHTITREEHSFSYSVIAAQRGDIVEHVAVAHALSDNVQQLLRSAEQEGTSFDPLIRLHSYGDGTRNSIVVNDHTYHDIDIRQLALSVWESASTIGSPEASVEMGLKYLFGDDDLSIRANETKARKYLNDCVSPSGRKMIESFSVECLPAQLILWWLDCKNFMNIYVKTAMQAINESLEGLMD